MELINWNLGWAVIYSGEFCKCNERDFWRQMGPIHIHELLQDFKQAIQRWAV